MELTYVADMNELLSNAKTVDNLHLACKMSSATSCGTHRLLSALWRLN